MMKLIVSVFSLFFIQFSALKAASAKKTTDTTPEDGDSDKKEEGDEESPEGDDGEEDGEKKTTSKVVQPIQTLKKKEIIFTVRSRNKRKNITYVQGFENFGFNAKELAKMFAKKFATATTVNEEGIQLQGDLCFDIASYLQELNGEIKNSSFILMKPGNIRSKLFPF